MANDKEDADILDSLEREAKEFDKVRGNDGARHEANTSRMPKSTVRLSHH
jgi:hypothetical protein